MNALKIKQAMIKKTILIAITALFTVNVWGQTWNTTTNGIYYNGGNVGIGAANPLTSLHIRGQITLEGLSKTNPPQKKWVIYHNADGNNDYGLKFNYDGETSLSIRDNNVGVGTISPDEKMHIEEGRMKLSATTYSTGASIMFLNTASANTESVIIGQRSFSDRKGLAIGDGTTDLFFVKSDGDVGVGTTTPLGKVDILAETDEVALRLSMPTSEDAAAYDIKWANSNADVIHRVQYSGTYYDFMNVNRASRNVSFIGGNVSIGTTASPYKLSVDGTIGAREVIVTSDAWADFVFESNYNLMPLKELDNYIQENNHLPEIPTTAEVKENGISVGEMNAKLLQKIEELTLHTIKQQELIETLLNRVEQIENK